METNSVFDTRTIDDIYKEIQNVYTSDSRPWVVGYSGGKDSTCALQLVWNALSLLPKSALKKPIYVICSDTYVETPVIIDYISATLEEIDKASKEQQMPIQAMRLFPLITESFWVNLIGRGYPAPSKAFRWCTERLKIKPADRFIMDKVSKHGEIVLILGVRRAESATRAQVMKLYKIEGKILSRHSKFPLAFVYTPIEDFSVDDVWLYLLQNPSPWGGNNRDLLALYKSASDTSECPLVVDTDTPPCGNSRFGCWVCTLVSKDRSVQALIDSGEDWLEPLLKFRNMLAKTQIPEKKRLYREYKRRNGTVSFKRDGSGELVPGPYKLEYSKKFLKKLLEIQEAVRQTGPDPNACLILPEEIHEIRRIWRSSRGDWEDTVPEIYQQVTGQSLDWIEEDLGAFSVQDAQLLERICSDHDIPFQLVAKLLDIERQTQGMNRRSGIYSRIERILNEEWRSEEEILRDSHRS